MIKMEGESREMVERESMMKIGNGANREERKQMGKWWDWTKSFYPKPN